MGVFQKQHRGAGGGGIQDVKCLEDLLLTTRSAKELAFVTDVSSINNSLLLVG